MDDIVLSRRLRLFINDQPELKLFFVARYVTCDEVETDEHVLLVGTEPHVLIEWWCNNTLSGDGLSGSNTLIVSGFEEGIETSFDELDRWVEKVDECAKRLRASYHPHPRYCE